MSYSDLNSIVLQKDAADSAAEVHGIAVAMLCLDKNTQASDWIHEAFADDQTLLQDDKVEFNNLFGQTRDLMASDEFVLLQHCRLHLFVTQLNSGQSSSLSFIC
jgi:uncharacterized protein YgfB (UPF0149 family)